MAKRKLHFREPWSFANLCKDGAYKKERLKGDLKKTYQKQTRNRLKQELNYKLKAMEVD